MPATLTQGKSFCQACGGIVVTPATGPKRCENCGREVFENPIPVVVGLIPVVEVGRTALLVLRRGIEPARGKFALPGGFLEIETWQTGLSREVREETNLTIAPDSWAPFGIASSAPNPNRLLAFATCPPVDIAAIGPFRPSTETLALGLVFGSGAREHEMAFPLHQRQIEAWFATRSNTGAADFREIAQAP